MLDGKHFPGRSLSARRGLGVALLCLASFWGQGAIAGQVLTATPATYRSLIGTLQAGDTLALEAGTYVDGLPISNKHGEPGNPIVITGPENGALAVFEGSRDQAWNTAQINNSSYITLRHLTLDGLDVPYLDAVNAGGVTHHITLENLLIIRHGGAGPNTDSQLSVGIATRGPAWDWIIRNNTIIGAGSGVPQDRPITAPPAYRIRLRVKVHGEGYSTAGRDG